MYRSELLAPALITTLLFASGCGSPEKPIEVAAISEFGAPGNTYSIAEDSLSSNKSGIETGLKSVYDNDACSITLVVKDLNKYPDLEFLSSGKQAAGRGFQGGDLYIAGNIDSQKERLDVAHLAAHEALHACVRTQITVAEEVTVKGSDYSARKFNGFHLADEFPVKKGTPSAGALDEAAVEWMASELAPDTFGNDTG